MLKAPTYQTILAPNDTLQDKTLTFATGAGPESS